MKTFTERLDIIAGIAGYYNWSAMTGYFRDTPAELLSYMTLAAKVYARDVAQDALDRAAESIYTLQPLEGMQEEIRATEIKPF